MIPALLFIPTAQRPAARPRDYAQCKPLRQFSGSLVHHAYWRHLPNKLLPCVSALCDNNLSLRSLNSAINCRFPSTLIAPRHNEQGAA